MNEEMGEFNKGFGLDRIEEFTANDVDSAIRRYSSNLRVSRNMFGSCDVDARPWTSPRPTPVEQSPVYDRLFQDFHRRQEAKKRLITIIDYKAQAAIKASLHIPNASTKRLKRSLSKPEVTQMVSRLNAYLQNKLLKIDKQRKELAERQEKEFKSMMQNKKPYKTDPEAFKRLTTPKLHPQKSADFKPDSKKTFSIREAIESGKRLMKCGKRVLNDLQPVTPSLSFVKTCPSGGWGRKRSARKTVGGEVEKIGSIEWEKRLSPKKIRKGEGRMNIDEVFRRCKNKVMMMSFAGKKNGDEDKEMLRTFDSYRSLALEKGLSN